MRLICSESAVKMFLRRTSRIDTNRRLRVVRTALRIASAHEASSSAQDMNRLVELNNRTMLISLA